MRGNRDLKAETRYQGDSLVRTLAMALIIASIIIFAAMIYPLIKIAPEGAGVSYYLPWVLPYGIVNVLIAFYGVFLTINGREHPKAFFLYSVIGVVLASLLFLEGIPIAIFLQNAEMAVSSLVIGACAIVIAALSISSTKKKD